MRESEKLARSASLVGSLTFLSRIAGYVRDMVIAYFFGATAYTDAFWIAFRIPNLLRRLFAEGSLTISFIPVFTDTLEKKNKEEAKKVSDIIFSILLVTLIAVSALGIIFSPYIVKLFAYGFDKETFDISVSLNRIMFPYILFISLTALCMGVLNSLRHFFAPALSPVLLNICVIGSVLLIQQKFDIPIYSAAIGVILGGLLQLLLQLPFIKAEGFLFRFRSSFKHPAVKRIGLLLVPQLFGIAVYNLNIIVSSQYASFMQSGTISYLYFAERLVEFPLGIIAVSIATVLLPSLSSLVSRGEFGKFRETYSSTLKLMLFILIPALAGLIALRIPICNLLYQRGEFTYEATLFTSQTLLGYSFGLWAVGGLRITAPAFYAMQDTKTPVIVAFLAFVVNAILGYVLGFTLKMNHTGLAVASSISSVFNFFTLVYLLERRTGDIKMKPLLVFCLKVIILSAVMAVIAWKISTYADWTRSVFSIRKLVVLLGAMGAAGIFYFASAKIIGLEELEYLLRLRRRKVERGN